VGPRRYTHYKIEIRRHQRTHCRRRKMIAGNPAAALDDDEVHPDQTIQMRHAGSDTIALTSTVAAAARLRVSEGRDGVRFKAYEKLNGRPDQDIKNGILAEEA
jgi:hypothetical protein